MSTPPINLRGVHLARSKKHLAISAIAAVMAFGGVMAWREKRKRKFQQFYQNFDADKLFDEMVKDGVYKSVLPDGTVTTEPWK